MTTFNNEGEDEMAVTLSKSVSKRALGAAQEAAKGLESADRINVPGTRFMIVREGGEADKKLSALTEEHLRMFTGECPGSSGEPIKFVAFTQ